MTKKALAEEEKPARELKELAREELFIKEYLRDLNGTQAYIRCGWTDNEGSASVGACRMLKKARVRARVSLEIAKSAARCRVTPDRVINELASTGFVNAVDAIDPNTGLVREDAARQDTAAIARVRVKTIPTEEGNIVERTIDFYDKHKALELLGKHLGMFADTVRLEGGQVPIIIDDVRGAGDAEGTGDG